MTVSRFGAMVGALVWRRSDGKHLLLQRSAQKDFAAGQWECVTGRVEQGESFSEAVRREASEELGQAVQIGARLAAERRGARRYADEYDMTNTAVRRPFYAEYAWAFDLLIDRPVRKECAAIAKWLVDRGILPGAEILDAGCGTGRYAIELARRGYVVHGVDLSPDLIDIATRAVGDSIGSVSFGVGDITHLPKSRYAAILCRGVLNDIIDDAGRNTVFAAFAEALQSNGVLILDVREWAASAERKIREPLFRKRVSTDRGELTFTSFTALDPEGRQLLISERHELIDKDEKRVSDFQFVMRCWEREELSERLTRHGFGKHAWFGAYDGGVTIGATDRLVVVGQR